jgi:hypothetical protein
VRLTCGERLRLPTFDIREIFAALDFRLFQQYRGQVDSSKTPTTARRERKPCNPSVSCDEPAESTLEEWMAWSGLKYSTNLAGDKAGSVDEARRFWCGDLERDSLSHRFAGGPGRTRTCNQTVMSGRISISFVDFPAFSFEFDRVRCVLVRSFLVRNWCGGAPAFGRQPANSRLSKRLGNLAQARGTIRVKSAGARRLLDHPIGRNEHGDRVGGGVILGQPGQRATRSAA